MKKTALILVLLLVTAFSFAFAEGGLPVLEITTDGGAEILSREEYVPCSVVMNGGEAIRAGIRVRGNTSAFMGDVEQIRMNPVPYRVKFDEKTNMFGLHDGERFRSWVLLVAEYNMVHTDLIFRMGRAMGTFYTSDSTLCELTVNGEDVGLYLVCEQNQVKKKRIAVPEPEEGYTGTDVGYLVEMDHYQEPPVFSVKYYDGAPLTDLEGETRGAVKRKYSIKSDVYDKAQEKFIAGYVSAVYEVLYRACVDGEYYSVNGKNKLVPSGAASAREACGAVMDLSAAVDMYILQEWTRNGDCGKGSLYFQADFSPESTDHRLKLTAPWDFSFVVETDPEGFIAATFRDEDFIETYGDNSNPWFILLCGQDWFREMVRDRLKELRENGTIDRVFAEEEEMLARIRPDLPEADWQIDGPDGAHEDMEWMRERLTWLEGAICR